jgi:hypothetical protein
VSQILHEGGGFPEDKAGGWYYDGRFFGEWGNAWTVVADFYAYMLKKGIADGPSPDGWAIIIEGKKTYIYPPLRNGKMVKFTFPGGVLHNSFVVGHDPATGTPLINTHSAGHYHVEWTLIPTNDDWATTLVTQYGVKWDY